MSGPSAQFKYYSQSPAPALSRHPWMFHKPWIRPLANASLFQIGWLIAVQGHDLLALVAAGAMLLAHWCWFSRQPGEWMFIALVVASGFLIDSALVAFGLFSHAGSEFMAPLWLLAIWAMFATTLCHAFSWLQNRLSLAAVLGAVAPPFSYWAGEQLSPMEFNEPVLALAAVVAVWTLLLPTLAYGARYVPKHVAR